MKKYFKLLVIVVLNITIANAQEVEVLTLGTFHFAFHNKDIVKTVKDNQIDVLDPKYQSEIERIVEKLSKFKPTIIAIELGPERQQETDSIFNEYIKGKYTLNREEHQQIGFRIAKKLGIKKLYCINDWGKLYEFNNKILNGTDSIAKQKFINFFNKNPDSLKFYHPKDIFKTEGILEELKLLNDEENLKKSLGNYLLSVFKYETKKNNFFGVDFTTGWWFNRNLRIFRNIQKIKINPKDKILVIYGADHMNVLNILFDSSPEYKLVKVNEYLK